MKLAEVWIHALLLPINFHVQFIQFILKIVKSCDITYDDTWYLPSLSDTASLPSGRRKGIRPAKQEAQLMLTNLWDEFRGQSRSTNIVPFIPYVRYSFLLCNSNFVFIIFPTFNFKKCHELETRVSAHSRSFKVVPFDRLRMVSY